MVERRKHAVVPITDFQCDRDAVLYGLATLRRHRKLLACFERVTPEMVAEAGVQWSSLKTVVRTLTDEIRKLEALVEWDADAVCGLTLEDIEQAFGPKLDALANLTDEIDSGLSDLTTRQARADGLNSMHALYRLLRGKFNWR